MKKILLGTTALLGAAGFAGAALAEAPKVTVGGYIDFQAGIYDYDLDAGTRGYNFQNDTELKFSVDGKADNGLGYGAVIILEADVSADGDGEGFNADKTYIYMDGMWGRVEMGANVGPTNTLKVDASTIAHGTGGIDGDFYKYVAFATPAYIISPDLPSDHGSATSAGIAGASGSSEDSEKVTYYTPKWNGFQAGVSYTPDMGDVGQFPFSGDVNGDAEDVFGLGLNYTGSFSGVGIAASATGEFGGAEIAAQDDLSAYAFGLNLSYAGFSLGGSYGNWEDSLSVASVDADFWNIGLAYEFGPFGASVTYLDSEYGSNDFQNLSVGADYQLAPGLVPYVEVNFFEADTAGVALDQDGTVGLVGVQLTF